MKRHSDVVSSVTKKADALLRNGEAFSAAALLGGLWSARKQWPKEGMDDFRRSIGERLANVDLSSLKAALGERCERLLRLLASGTQYEFEEIVLALTLRIEIAMVKVLFLDVMNISLEANMLQCDDRLIEISRHPLNADAFADALSSLRRNWRSEIDFDTSELGIDHIWFLR